MPLLERNLAGLAVGVSHGAILIRVFLLIQEPSRAMMR